jgi:chemotaxis signal transduction protein
MQANQEQARGETSGASRELLNFTRGHAEYVIDILKVQK